MLEPCVDVRAFVDPIKESEGRVRKRRTFDASSVRTPKREVSRRVAEIERPSELASHAPDPRDRTGDMVLVVRRIHLLLLVTMILRRSRVHLEEYLGVSSPVRPARDACVVGYLRTCLET